MKSFKRIFKYIWPQWPRIIVVVISAIIVAILLSISFMTVIPLLEVMMGEEGLPSWADKKVCSWRYGMEFQVVGLTDITLLVINVEKESSALQAGFKQADRITGVLGGYVVDEQDNGQNVTAAKLLEKLANAPRQGIIAIQVGRINQQGRVENLRLELNAALETGDAARWRIKSALKAVAIDLTQWGISFVSREQGPQQRTEAVIYIIVLMGIITIIRCVAKFYQGYLAEKIVQIGINHLREDAFGHVMDMPIGFFADERPSDTVSRLISDTSVMGKTVKIMLGKALREPLNAAFMLGFAMWLNWQLALIFLCSAPFAVAMVGIFGKKIKRATGKSLVAGSEMLGKLQETMAGLKIVKVYNQQSHEREAFATINSRLLKQLLKISKVNSLTSPTMEVLGMLGGSAALIMGAYWVSSNKMQSSEFMVLLLLLGAAAEAIRKTSGIWNKIQEANAAGDRVFALMDEPAELEMPGAIELSPLQNKIEFRDIVFTYPASAESVLKGINLVVTAGHNVAIVGPNGSGKTTLVNLLPRFYNPGSGEILIDGQDIRGVSLSSLRDQIGMVTQGMVTFNDTIAANIAYGKLGATREEIIAAAKRAFAHEFIDPLPDGYDTIIGEQGSGLSGGQLQRIVIARAILKNPTILIFDEATSQIDADSEAKIHKAIEEFMQNRTTFLIAHRFSTVVNADVIVVMDDGQIVAQGQHNTLIKTCPLYQSLYETQLIASE